MSRIISSILSKEKSILNSTLEVLEKASGQTDIDARLTSELVVKSKLKIRQLGLDPEDSTSPELYQALLNLVELHDQFLVSKLACKDNADTTDILPRITKIVSSSAKTKSIWGIKHSVAKRILKANPPKRLMKSLGYRSLDSMLKRESIDSLLAGAYICESSEWAKQLYLRYSSLTASDFESRKISISYLNNKKWQKISKHYITKNKNNVIELKELGSVVVVPLPVEKLKGVTVLALSLVLNGVKEIQLYSSFFKFFQVHNHFGQIVSDAISKGISDIANIGGEDINWNVIHDHFMELAKTGNTEIFEPHIQVEDLEVESIEESLYKLEPALHFWYGSECIGIPYKGGTVSFNLMDVATDYVNSLSLEQSSVSYLRNSLWDELMKRYIREEPIHEQVYDQIDQSINTEDYNQNLGGVVFA